MKLEPIHEPSGLSFAEVARDRAAGEKPAETETGDRDLPSEDEKRL